MKSFPLLFYFFGVVVLDEHVLLDTRTEIMLDWKRYPYDQNDSKSPGWIEESFTNFTKGIHWRTYVVCDIGYNEVDNWLWTPSVRRGNANRIYIEVQFSIRNCNNFPGTAVNCKETFSLLYQEFDWAREEGDSYKLIDRIAADEGRTTDNNEVYISREVRSVSVSKKEVKFAIRDQGACISIIALKIYYLTCPETTVGFARYPETATGPEISSVLQVKGQCVDNSVAVTTPYYLCKSDGMWNIPIGECVCMEGYEADDDVTQTCRACPVGTFKHVRGKSPCMICPPHSQSLYTGSVECSCNNGYFRAVTDPKNAACTRPPSAPMNPTFKFLDDTTVIVSWDPPLDDGARADTVYSVKCDFCPDKTTYSPSIRTPFLETKIIISGLEPDGEIYNFEIFAHNGVSKYASLESLKASSITVTVQTKSNSSSVSPIDVRISISSPDKISLSWINPDKHEVEAYQVKYFIRGQRDNTSHIFLTNKDHAEINDLNPDEDYAFQVQAKTLNGWGPFSIPVYRLKERGYLYESTFYKNQVYDHEDGEKNATAVTVAISVLIAVFVVAAVLFLVRRRRRRLNRLPHKTSLETQADYRGIDYPISNPTMTTTTTTATMSTTIQADLKRRYFTHNQKTYVDPHTYEDPNAAVRQFAKEIDSRFITIEAIIGGGEFGDVCRGRLTATVGGVDRSDMMVAIKTLKPGSAEKARSDFLTEASIMGQFEHPNVIFLQGVVTKTNPIMIITEYMENGSLDTFLRANDGKFQIMQLVGMMRGIAYGMQYLSEMNFVHRDLAARNVLVNSQLVCKIADFGLSREVADKNGMDPGAYTTRGGKIPVRWTAPEAIAFRKFTSSSDVWSFGIVMWEVMSYGERPYWTWSNQDVIKAIEKGYRLPAPMDSPEAIHQLMLDCWQKDRSHRPSFVSIVKTLDKLICCPETLRKIAGNASSYNPCSTTFQCVEEWLESIKMTRYIDNFTAAGVVNMNDVTKLTLQRLVELGITLVGHQKKIMGSVHAMRAQIVSEGFLV